MTSVQTLIHDIVASIDPFDELEVEHQQDVLDWISSGSPLFRLAKPDIPPKHLVSYFILYDGDCDKVLLIDHAKAKAWLPTGGHVERDEDPRATVTRELAEELGLTASFKTRFGRDPLLVTVTTTKGCGDHTDVSLWYVVHGDSTQVVDYDADEMHGHQWLLPTEILEMPITDLDPHMHRFIRKMQAFPRLTSARTQT